MSLGGRFAYGADRGAGAEVVGAIDLREDEVAPHRELDIDVRMVDRYLSPALAERSVGGLGDADNISRQVRVELHELTAPD